MENIAIMLQIDVLANTVSMVVPGKTRDQTCGANADQNIPGSAVNMNMMPVRRGQKENVKIGLRVLTMVSTLYIFFVLRVFFKCY